MGKNIKMQLFRIDTERLILSLVRSRVELYEGVAQSNGKQSRMGLGEKLDASRTHGIIGRRLKTEGQRLALLFFLEDAWMILLQPPAFPKVFYFTLFYFIFKVYF